MLLTALETYLKVKLSVLMLRFCSAGGISSKLVVELVLRSSLKYSAHSSSSSINDVGGSPFRLFTDDGDVFDLSPFNFMTMLKSSLISFLVLAASSSTHICSILLILSFTSDVSASTAIFVHVCSSRNCDDFDIFFVQIVAVQSGLSFGLTPMVSLPPSLWKRF